MRGQRCNECGAEIIAILPTLAPAKAPVICLECSGASLSDFVDDEDDSQAWLCGCGNYEESGLHCRSCGGEPPWGCDCSDHDADNYDGGYFIEGGLP